MIDPFLGNRPELNNICFSSGPLALTIDHPTFYKNGDKVCLIPKAGHTLE